MADSERLPALTTETIAGFIEALAEHRTGSAIGVATDRPDLGRVVFDAS